MDSLLGSLFSEGTDDERRAKAEDFVSRVESGNPTEGFSTEEALTSFSQVAGNLSPDELQDATAQALERFSPEQRREFSALLQSKTGGGDATDDPQKIAQLTSQLQSQSPEGLLGALGGGGGLDSILGGLLGGGGASSGGGGGLVSDLLGGLFGGGKKDSGGAQAGGFDLSNPMVQAILAAIAAIAMKKFMGGKDDAPKQAPAPGGGSGGGGLTGGGWQPKTASSEPAESQQPEQSAQSGGGWQPKTASQTEGDAKPERSGGLKGVDAKDA